MSLSFTRKDFNKLCHVIELWMNGKNCKYIFMVLFENLAIYHPFVYSAYQHTCCGCLEVFLNIHVFVDTNNRRETMPLAGKHDDIQWNKFHQEPTNDILNRACRSGGHCLGPLHNRVYWNELGNWNGTHKFNQVIWTHLKHKNPDITWGLNELHWIDKLDSEPVACITNVKRCSAKRF